MIFSYNNINDYIGVDINISILILLLCTVLDTLLSAVSQFFSICFLALLSVSVILSLSLCLSGVSFVPSSHPPAVLPALDGEASTGAGLYCDRWLG